MDLTLAWCLNAKNSLGRVHGFSPFELILFGQFPKLPSTFANEPPALIQHNNSKIITGNLAALHKGRQAFISSKSSEKIQRDLNNNVQTSGDTKYITRVSVYFKKINETLEGPRKGIRSRWATSFSKIWQQLCKSPSMLAAIGYKCLNLKPQCSIKLDKAKSDKRQKQQPHYLRI